MMECFPTSVLVLFAFVVMVGCVTTNADGAKPHSAMSAPSVVATSGKKESHVEVVGERVTVFVYIDADASDIPRCMLEPTGMLRTKGWLRKEFKDLPQQFNVPCRVLSRGFDDDDVVYEYVTEFKLKDIKRLVAGQGEN